MNAQVEGATVATRNKPGPKKGFKQNKPEVPKEPEGPTRDERIAKMNDHIQRMWNGQSRNLGVAERSGRIKFSIKKHGWVDIMDELDINETDEPSFNNSTNLKISQFL